MQCKRQAGSEVLSAEMGALLFPKTQIVKLKHKPKERSRESQQAGGVQILPKHTYSTQHHHTHRQHVSFLFLSFTVTGSSTDAMGVTGGGVRMTHAWDTAVA